MLKTPVKYFCFDEATGADTPPGRHPPGCVVFGLLTRAAVFTTLPQYYCGQINTLTLKALNSSRENLYCNK